MADKDDGTPKPAESQPDVSQANFQNPIVILATLILLSLFVMIGASMLGVDHGFLSGMARPELARGLITYLFAIVTIGIAVALVLNTLVGPAPSDANDGRFQRAKEVLSLLLGVFGTIVGYYFGAESSKANLEAPFELSTPDLSPQPVGPAGLVTVRAVIKGGTAPLQYGVGQGTDNVEVKDLAFEGGWIVKQVQLKAPSPAEVQSIHLVVEDSSGKRIDRVVPVRRSAQD
ncbi:hypothetical protein MesoLj113a_27660 [Mesorhizobium sp. 113-1-2]|uniref:hypothetical protein n=1 Tax=Mesorhizobium sp. 113-1-2 TaxID=2744515 RepID=UPI001925E82B|nr:hypothetical protein [Mesorhizobium sp. 113-1-2]BCG71608.1 hypothetical protein MesoLj113a_27660 [Mesorhizobium sp. 113-1-2]